MLGIMFHNLANITATISSKKFKVHQIFEVADIEKFEKEIKKSSSKPRVVLVSGHVLLQQMKPETLKDVKVILKDKPSVLLKNKLPIIDAKENSTIGSWTRCDMVTITAYLTKQINKYKHLELKYI